MRPLLSDERLSRRLATGEAAAFDELYRRYSHRLAAYAASLLGDRAAGEDVAQVALLNAYQSLRRGKVPDRVRPWLFRIAHNEAVDLLARRRELLHGIEAAEQPAPDDPSGERGALLDALAKLPERQRRAYVLREVHGLRVAEIAAELSLAVPQVEQALFAARNRLAEELVFPDGLTCDAARRLVGGPLAAIERRALRRHFRTCARCRADGVTVAPGLSVEWLRGRIADVLVGGSGPAAAKATALVAATVAGAGVGVGPKLLAQEPHARVAYVPPAAAVPQRRAPAVPHPVTVALVSSVAAPRRQVPAKPLVVVRSVDDRRDTRTDESRTTTRRDDGRQRREQEPRTVRGDDGSRAARQQSERGDGGDGHDGETTTQPQQTTTAPQALTTTLDLTVTSPSSDG